MQSGRLPIALEGLAKYVRGYAEARAAIGLALWYPLLVLCLAYVLFLGLLYLAVPRIVDAADVLGTARDLSLSLVGAARRADALLVAGRAGPALGALDRLGEVGLGLAIPGGLAELALAFPLDEVDPGQL